jgi:paraquat-inducible protein B
MTSAPNEVPTAVLKPRRRVSLAWIVPAVAVLAAAWLAVGAWRGRGVPVRVLLDRGYGLRVGDEVRYRGVPVGEIRAIELDETGTGIRVTAALHGRAEGLARGGSRFWVVRPQLGLSRVEGLETLIGPRYLAVLPGDGPPRRNFVGLTEPPVVERQEPGDLEIVLTASEKGGLRRGAPVIFRQVRVGTVLSVGLASDGGAVEARLHVDKAYAQLIREGTRFWDVGGIEATMGITGVTLEMESLEALLAGGVALATPPEAGDVVRTGHRFALESEPPDDWVEWNPMAVIGSHLLPPGAPLPAPLRARSGWMKGRWISRKRSFQGWVLQTDEGLLGPVDLLKAEEDADRETAVLEVAGAELPLLVAPTWEEDGLALLADRVGDAVWPCRRCRSATVPEDCLAVGDPTATPLPLAASRLTAAGDGWAVDPAVSVDESWHGAAVVARKDGYLIGLLLVEKGQARVGLLGGMGPWGGGMGSELE